MKYRYSNLPNTGHAIRYKLQDKEGKNQSVFSFSHELIDIWGNPKEEKLGEVMIAYVKSHGWVKEPVALGADNSLKNLNNFIGAMPKAKA